MDALKDIKKNQKMTEFYGYWAERCRDGQLPSRADLDPTEIPSVLGSMLLLDVERSPSGDLRFRIRLFGSAHVEFNQADFTGQYIDEILSPGDVDAVLDVYREMVETGEPHFWQSHVRMAGREHRYYERLMLPLASDGKTVDMLVGVFEFGVRPKAKLYKSIPVAEVAAG